MAKIGWGDLLILDDFGLSALSEADSKDLLEVIAECPSFRVHFRCVNTSVPKAFHLLRLVHLLCHFFRDFFTSIHTSRWDGHF